MLYGSVEIRFWFGMTIAAAAAQIAGPGQLHADGPLHQQQWCGPTRPIQLESGRVHAQRRRSNVRRGVPRGVDRMPRCMLPLALVITAVLAPLSGQAMPPFKFKSVKWTFRTAGRCFPVPDRMPLTTIVSLVTPPA
jgi:hypothetical protein